VRSRRTWLMYVLTLATGGLVGFVWVVLMLRDANLVTGRREGWPVLSKVFLGSLAVYYILFVLIISSPFASPIHRMLILPEVLLAIVLLGMVIALVVTIRNRICVALNFTPSAKDTILIIVLTFPWFISLIILQQRLNRLAERAGVPSQ
jgi:hypothetical protein